MKRLGGFKSWRLWVRLAWMALCSGLSYLLISPIASLSFRIWDPSGRVYHRLQRLWGRIVLWSVGVRLRLHAEGPLPSGPVVFAVNHTSALDIPVLMVAIPVPFAFLYKKELLRVPIFGFFLRHSPHIVIDRSGRKEALESLRLAGERIRRGLSAVIFPEGTRSPDGRLLPFKRGAFAIAAEAGVPLVPIVIRGAHRVWPARSWPVAPGSVEVHIGPPVHPEGFERAQTEALMSRLRFFMEARLTRQD
ncbi:MAG: 1-acyl-sn-glycerol-3-phosphate acyltransferase [Bacteroidetes bacterium]|nr:1-acyl-sn-glycerol-3-phosphate acyltransferase [Bacteroidota bacterium]